MKYLRKAAGCERPWGSSRYKGEHCVAEPDVEQPTIRFRACVLRLSPNKGADSGVPNYSCGEPTVCGLLKPHPDAVHRPLILFSVPLPKETK